MLACKMNIQRKLIFLVALTMLAATSAYSADDESGEKILSAMRHSNQSVSRFEGRFTITTVQYEYPDDLDGLQEDLKFYSEKLGNVSGPQKQVYLSVVQQKKQEIEQLKSAGKIARIKTSEFSGIFTKDLKKFHLIALGEDDFREYVSNGRDGLFIVADGRQKSSAVSSMDNKKNSVALIKDEIQIVGKWAGEINHITNRPDIVSALQYENRRTLRVKEDMGLLRAEHLVVPEYNYNSVHSTVLNAGSNEKVMELKSQDWVKLSDDIWRPMTLSIAYYQEGKNRVYLEKILQFRETPRVNQPIAAETFETAVPPDTTMVDYYDEDLHLVLAKKSTLKWLKLAILDCQSWRKSLSKWQKDN